MQGNIGKEILKYRDEILEDVVQAVGIESYAGEPSEGKPFGEGPAKALDYCLKLAQEFGLQVKNVGNRAGHIEYGEGEGLVGVLAHVDVVPAGEGWTYSPFKGTVKDGRIYGRGTMDDKGPAISAIYCLKTLKDLGITPSRRIRVILGASEERGMDDMKYYFAHEEMPDFAFTPDGEYPICNHEKGILQLTLSFEKTAGRLVSFEAGNAPNMVPVMAKAVVLCSAVECDKLKQKAESIANVGFKFNSSESGKCEITCTGLAAHASTPEKGVNAASSLLQLLSDVSDEKLVRFLNDKIGMTNDGSSLGIDCSDESGKLTLNLGIVHKNPDVCEAVIDIRYPVSYKGEDITVKIKETAAKYGAEITGVHDSVPLTVESDSFLIQKLKSAYETVTGGKAKLYSTGGGSYARSLENRGVAFGAGIKPLSYYNIHGADEFLEIEDFMLHCEICLQAIYELSSD